MTLFEFKSIAHTNTEILDLQTKSISTSKNFKQILEVHGNTINSTKLEVQQKTG